MFESELCIKFLHQEEQYTQDIFVAQLVLIDQAAQESEYDRNYIRYLARKQLIKGEKHGGTWLIDLESLEIYEKRMKEEGTKKFDPTKNQK